MSSHYFESTFSWLRSGTSDFARRRRRFPQDAIAEILESRELLTVFFDDSAVTSGWANDVSGKDKHTDSGPTDIRHIHNGEIDYGQKGFINKANPLPLNSFDSLFAAPPIISAGPILTGPAATTESSTPTITWTTVTGASSYRIWVANLSTGERPVIDTSVSTTFYTPTSTLGIGEYRIWVRAVFDDGLVTGWSDPRDVHINTRVSNESVTTPSITGLPTFTWSELEGAVKYDVWVNNNTTGVPQVIRNENVTSTTFTPTSALPLGSYTFWVRGIDANGVAGRWSAGAISNVTPYPTLTGPELVTFDTTPEITWTAVNGAVRYDLYVSAAGSTPAIIRESSLTSTSFTPQSALSNGKYNIWVRALAADGFAGNWSPVRTVEIGGAPTITAPPTNTLDTTPTFAWTAVGGAASYEIWINRLVVSVSPYLNVTDITSTSFTPSSEMPVGSYRVWVRAVSSTGTFSPWSKGVTFAIGAIS